MAKKLSELQEMVNFNIVQSAERQQHSYHVSSPPQLKQGQKVLLNNPTKGKLDPRWTGPWVVKQYDNSTTVRLTKTIKNRWCTSIRSAPSLKRTMRVWLLNGVRINLQYHQLHDRTHADNSAKASVIQRL